MAKSYRVTSAGVNPAEDRAHRQRMYYISMILRVVCVASLFWVTGWWVLVAALGAVFLPWFAVMVGNAVAYGGEQDLESPDPRELTATTSTDTPVEHDPGIIVVDVEPERRGTHADPTETREAP